MQLNQLVLKVGNPNRNDTGNSPNAVKPVSIERVMLTRCRKGTKQMQLNQLVLKEKWARGYMK